MEGNPEGIQNQRPLGIMELSVYFLIGFANRLLVMIQWGLSFLTKRRGVRILSQRRQALDKE